MIQICLADMYRHDGRHDSRYVADTIAVCTAEYVARGVVIFG